MHLEGTAEQKLELLQALMRAQAEFPPIAKTKSAYNYKYAPLPEIHEKIRPILVKHDLAVFHPMSRLDGHQTVNTLVVHKSGGWLLSDGLTIPENIKIQDQGSYVTYISRYGYCATLGITSQDEDDTVLAAKSPRQKAATSPRRDGVAQTGRATLASTVAPSSFPAPVPSVDSGSIPDPSLPTKQERTAYVVKLNDYRKHITDDALQAYLLKRSGATEVRLIKKAQWDAILQELDKALDFGPDVLKAQVS